MLNSTRPSETIWLRNAVRLGNNTYLCDAFGQQGVHTLVMALSSNG